MGESKKEFLNVLENVLRNYSFSPVIAWALRFFLRNPYESIVIVDKNGLFEFMDRGSEKLFNLPEGGAKKKKVMELIPDSALPRVLETGVPVVGRIFDVKGLKKIGSAYPLVKDGEIIGAIGRLISRSLEEMERVQREMDSLKRKLSHLQQRQEEHLRAFYTFDNIVGASPAIKEAIKLAKKLSAIDTDVLILGESGTGKELFAHAIHNYTNPERPFVRVNCPTIPFELAESELFGYEKGAFTGAKPEGKKGKFELAKNGTIFLDEVNSLPLSIQAKLLRVLQEREIERLGSSHIQKVNFRLIATSNVDLKKGVIEGKFREDLYYRIAKAVIYIPPLRDRKEDIETYISYFLKAINNRFGTHFKRATEEAFKCMTNYKWPGNVRELINILEQACLKAWEGEEIPASSLPSDLFRSSTPFITTQSNPIKKEIEEREKDLILQVLKQTKGNKRKASSLLGMPRSTLYNKIKKYNLAKNISENISG